MILLDLKRLLTPFVQAGRTPIGLHGTLGGGLADTGSGSLGGRGGFRVVTVELLDGLDHYGDSSVSTTIVSLGGGGSGCSGEGGGRGKDILGVDGAVGAGGTAFDLLVCVCVCV